MNYQLNILWCGLAIEHTYCEMVVVPFMTNGFVKFVFGNDEHMTTGIFLERPFCNKSKGSLVANPHSTTDHEIEVFALVCIEHIYPCSILADEILNLVPVLTFHTYRKSLITSHSSL